MESMAANYGMPGWNQSAKTATGGIRARRSPDAANFMASGVVQPAEDRKSAPRLRAAILRQSIAHDRRRIAIRWHRIAAYEFSCCDTK